MPFSKNAPKPENLLKTTKTNSSSKSAFNSALRILTRRDHSRYELVLKLKQRGFSSNDIDHAVSTCEEYDYINDERTAAVYIRQLKRKGYGKKRIQLELKKKGLRGDRILKILDENVSETNERESAERMLTKNLKRFEREADLQKRRQKIYRFLQARGFSREVITETIIKNG